MTEIETARRVFLDGPDGEPLYDGDGRRKETRVGLVAGYLPQYVGWEGKNWLLHESLPDSPPQYRRAA
jgi:hypothetical protein